MRVVREVYPLVKVRHGAPVAILGLAHRRLRATARELGEDEYEWPDMALRLMLERERGQ